MSRRRLLEINTRGSELNTDISEHKWRKINDKKTGRIATKFTKTISNSASSNRVLRDFKVFYMNNRVPSRFPPILIGALARPLVASIPGRDAQT